MIEEVQLNQYSLKENINLSFNTQVDIYGQAVLKRIKNKKEDLSELIANQFNSTKGLNISFSLNGELSGNIICQLSDKLLESEELSINIESMNILLGKMLTNLEEKLNISSVISSPKLLDSNHIFFKTLMNHTHHINLKTTYQLLTLKNTYKCDVYILAERSKISEV